MFNYIIAHKHPWLRYYVPIWLLIVLLAYEVVYICQMFDHLCRHFCSDSCCCRGRASRGDGSQPGENTCCSWLLWIIRLALTLCVIALLVVHYIASNSNHAYPIVCWEFGCIVLSVILLAIRHMLRSSSTTAEQLALMD